MKRNEIQILESDSLSGNLVWQLSNIKELTCDRRITKDLPNFLLDNEKPQRNLVAAFAGINFHVDNVEIELVSPCYILKEKNHKETSKGFFAPVIVIIVIIVLVSPVVTAIIIRKKISAL